MNVENFLFAILPALQIYHLIVSLLASVGSLMMMQVIGEEWTLARQNTLLQHMQRFGLALMSITLFCSAVRVPMLVADPRVLLSAAAVNTALVIVMVPTAVLGHRRHAP